MEDIVESVRNLFKNKFNVRFIQSCKRESKNGTYKSRLLALTDHRIFFLLKSPLCVEKFFYIIDIKGLECLSSDKLSITSSSKTVVVTSESGFMQTIREILVCMRRILPSIPVKSLLQKLTLPSQQTADDISSQVEGVDIEILPCGGFSSTYRCMCDFFTYPCLEDVIWDVEAIYYLHDSKEFNFRDFDYVDNKYHIPILATLQHNSYFTGLNLSNIKMVQQNVIELSKVLKTNCKLKHLDLSNTSLKTTHVDRLCEAISQNPSSSISFLNVSKNSLDEKSIANISSLNLKWRILIMSETSMSQNSLINFFNSISENSFNFKSLVHVDVSRNVLKKDASLALFSFLTHPNSIEKLILEQCEVSLENCFDHLLKGCVENLQELNLSGCHANKKKLNDGVLFRWKDFFSSARSLRILVLNHCHLGHDALKSILLGLAVNPFISTLELRLSGNSFDSKILDVFEVCIPLLTKITSLDISNNNFVADDFKILFEKMAQMKSLKNLYVGRNLQNSKSKSLESAVEAIVNYLKNEELALECLHLDDMSLKSDAFLLLNHLGGDTHLVELNISSNYIGPTGACLLSKALQINCKLKRILLDRNDLNLQALHDISHALSRNYFLKCFSLPLHDILAIQKVNPDRTDKLEEVIKKIEHHINRNNSPALLLQEKSFTPRACSIRAASLSDDLMTTSNKLRDVIADLNPGVSLQNKTLVDDSKVLLNESHAFIKTFNEYQSSLDENKTIFPDRDGLMKLMKKLKSSGSAHQTESVKNVVRYFSKTCPKHFEIIKERINFDEVKLHEIITSPMLAKIFEDVEQTLNVAMPFAILELLKVISELLATNLEEVIDNLISKTNMFKESQSIAAPKIRNTSNYLKKRRSTLKEEIKGLNESLLESSFLKATRMMRPTSSIIENPDLFYLPILSDSLEHLNLQRPKPPKKHKAIVPVLKIGNAEPIKTPKPLPRKPMTKEPKHKLKTPNESYA